MTATPSHSSVLEIRGPQTTWMLAGIAATLCLFAALWFLFSTLVRLGDNGQQGRMVMVSALCWMVCAAMLWKARTPQSRLHAVMSALGCVLIVAIFGTGFAFLGHLLRGVMFDRRVLWAFLVLSVALLVAQVVLAVPSAILMQQIVLRRRPPPSEA